MNRIWAGIDSGHRSPRRMPGIGPLLGAELLAGVGSDFAFFATPDRLAAFAGLAPTPHDSGKKSGNLHRPRHYHRGLQRVVYMSALNSFGTVPDIVCQCF